MATTTGKKRASSRTASPPPRWRMHRDWMSMLLPIFITVGLSVVANICVGFYEAGTFKAQVNSIDVHQRLQDAAIKENADALHTILNRLPTDYMPRLEIEQNRERNKEARDIENQRMTAIEEKLDRLLERSASPQR